MSLSPPASSSSPCPVSAASCDPPPSHPTHQPPIIPDEQEILVARKYTFYSAEMRQRVVDSSRDGEGWKAVANALKVPVEVACQWIRRYADGSDSAERARGGSKPKVTSEHVLFMCNALDDNNKLTLKELVGVLKTLKGACYTLKKPHVQPQCMNTAENKRKREQFLTKLLEYKSRDCMIYYLDETNLNTWTSRTKGRSLKNTRCVEERVSGGGKNMHVTACISQNGLVHYESRFGANRAPDVKIFFFNLLSAVRDEHQEPLDKAVFVLDNVPCHTGIESVLEQEEFTAATVLRLGPYSPMLNPIEIVFSSFKAEVKSYLAREAPNIRRIPQGSTIVAHRSAYLEHASNTFISEAVSATDCAAFDAHALRFYRSVFMLEDMPVGK